MVLKSLAGSAIHTYMQSFIQIRKLSGWHFLTSQMQVAFEYFRHEDEPEKDESNHKVAVKS